MLVTFLLSTLGAVVAGVVIGTIIAYRRYKRGDYTD